jgi:hypothetical protein
MVVAELNEEVIVDVFSSGAHNEEVCQVMESHGEWMSFGVVNQVSELEEPVVA